MTTPKSPRDAESIGQGRPVGTITASPIGKLKPVVSLLAWLVPLGTLGALDFLDVWNFVF